MKQKHWTIGDVSEYLNVKRSTLYSWVRNGTIPAYKIGGALLFKPHEIMAVVEASRVIPCNVRSLKQKNTKTQDIDAIVNKAIAEHQPKGYNPSKRKTSPKLGSHGRRI